MTPPTEPARFEAADEPARAPLTIEDWALVIVMGFLACITLGNVLLRHFTNTFAWTEGFSVFLMLVLALVAASAAVARDHRRARSVSFPGIAAGKP